MGEQKEVIDADNPQETIDNLVSVINSLRSGMKRCTECGEEYCSPKCWVLDSVKESAPERKFKWGSSP